MQENENEMTKEGLTRAKLTGKCQIPNIIRSLIILVSDLIILVSDLIILVSDLIILVSDLIILVSDLTETVT